MYTKKGIVAMLKRIVSNEGSPFVYLAIGEGDKGLSEQDQFLQKEIHSEGMSRVLAQVIHSEDNLDEVTLLATFSVMRDVLINEIGIFDEGVGGTMLARELVGPYKCTLGTEYTAKFVISFAEAFG